MTTSKYIRQQIEFATIWTITTAALALGLFNGRLIVENGMHLIDHNGHHKYTEQARNDQQKNTMQSKINAFKNRNR